MNEPRRLSQSGGVAQRLLDSASIDKPSEAARRRAEMFAGTASSFTRAADSGVQRTRRASVAKTLVIWAGIGAAASAALAFAGSRLLDDGAAASMPPAVSPMAELPQVAAARSSDISAEPSSDEARTLQSAREALTRGDDSVALSILNQYDQSHPSGGLKADAMALRIQVLSKSGRTSEAKDLATEFAKKYPEHPLNQQLKTLPR